MKPITKQSGSKAAFTIVELLTVMSIIIILIGLLVPGLNMAKRYAKFVTQKNQFRGISEALEAFSAEEEGYPGSAVLPGVSAPSCTTGAHRLAEAIVGRDLQGFDPFSTWDAAADQARSIYGRGTAAEIAASLERRKGPYLQLANVEAFQVAELDYPGGPGSVYPGSNPQYPAPVLTDVYGHKRVTLLDGVTSRRAGAPILYYKANVSTTIFDPANPVNSIYNIQDNQPLVALGHMVDGTIHHIDPAYTDPITGQDGQQIFYEKITNPQIRPLTRPYNQDSYILISAGFDGLYGTNDDVFNFGR